MSARRPQPDGVAGGAAASARISYEVRARVPAPLASAYEGYLREVHIPDLLATGCFAQATFARLTGEDGGDRDSREGAESGGAFGHAAFRSAYLAWDREALDRYLEKHAPVLRREALARFPEGLSFEREIWAVREQWPAEGGTWPAEAREALDPIP